MSAYTYEEIGKNIQRCNARLGISVSFEDENSLHKKFQSAVNSGSRHIEMSSLAKHGGARNFDMSSSMISEIRHSADLNVVTLGVHASPDINICGSGNNGFSSEIRDHSIREGKAAIDFCHVIKGKHVVIHANSFSRPVSEIDPELFGSKNTGSYYLVDPRTEEITSIPEQESVFIPKQAKGEKGNLLWILDRNRKPVLNTATQKPIPRLAVDADGRIEGEQVRFGEYIRRMSREGKTSNEAVKDFFHLWHAGEINRVYLNLVAAERTLAEAQSRRDRLQDTLEYYRNLEGVLPQEERYRLERTMRDSLNSADIAVPSDVRSACLLLEDELRENQRTLESSRQSIVRGWPQLTDAIEHLREIMSLKEFGLQIIAESIAELGEYAISLDGGRISLSIENLPLPYMYGSSTRELLEIIEESRKLLELRLKKLGYSSSESKALSNSCIKATLDIGHLNLCRQYYIGETFPKWVVSQVRYLGKYNISNVHLSDNRGLDDSHLLPGEGNAPIKEALSALLDLGYREFIVIEGAVSQQAVKYTLDLFGIVPRGSNDELMREFNARDGVSGMKWKDDPERPSFGKD